MSIDDRATTVLTKIAMALFDIVPHAAATERVFSVAGYMHSKARSRMSPDTLRMLTTIKLFEINDGCLKAHSKPPRAPTLEEPASFDPLDDVVLVGEANAGDVPVDVRSIEGHENSVAASVEQVEQQDAYANDSNGDGSDSEWDPDEMENDLANDENLNAEKDDGAPDPDTVGRPEVDLLPSMFTMEANDTAQSTVFCCGWKDFDLNEPLVDINQRFAPEQADQISLLGSAATNFVPVQMSEN